jgi:hypothetical protein
LPSKRHVLDANGQLIGKFSRKVARHHRAQHGAKVRSPFGAEAIVKPRLRRGGSRRTSPSCRSYCARAQRPNYHLSCALNVRDANLFELSMGEKWLDLLKKLSPSTKQVAILSNPVTSTAPFAKLYFQSIKIPGATAMA